MERALRRDGEGKAGVSTDHTESAATLTLPTCTRYPHTPGGTHANALRDSKVPDCCTGTPGHTQPGVHTCTAPATQAPVTPDSARCVHTPCTLSGTHRYPDMQERGTDTPAHTHVGTPSGMYRYRPRAHGNAAGEAHTHSHLITHSHLSAHVHTLAHVHSHPRACTYSRRGRAPGPAGAANGEPLPVTWADTRGARRSLWFRRARRAPPGGREECVQRGRWVAPGRGQGSPQDWHRQDLGVPSPFKRAWKTEKVLVLARG